jgi:hypothetical protein
MRTLVQIAYLCSLFSAFMYIVSANYLMSTHFLVISVLARIEMLSDKLKETRDD